MSHISKGAALILAASLTLAGCASRSEDVSAAYVSPVAYESYSCKELSQEAQRVSSAAATAAGVQDSQRSKDTAATAAAVIIFWPAAFFVGGDNAKTAELAQLKGQSQAIEQASVQKKCGIKFQRG